MTIPKDVLDALMKDYKNPEDLIGETGLLKQLTKQLLERAMQAEMTDHLGYEKNAPSNNKSGNTRNGSYQKKVKGGVRQPRHYRPPRPRFQFRTGNPSQGAEPFHRLR